LTSGFAVFAAAGALSRVSGFTEAFAGGAACVFALAAGLGVGEGFTVAVFVFAGTGTRITPSCGMNGLPVLGSIV
jgi:hypothetical protein